jgi:hypothetical protein
MLMLMKVMQVRKKDDGKIYAMKVLRKDTIIARKQVTHTKSEKNISFCFPLSFFFVCCVCYDISFLCVCLFVICIRFVYMFVDTFLFICIVYISLIELTY